LNGRRWTPCLALLVLAGPLVFAGGRAAARPAPPTVMHIYNGAGASLPTSLQAIHAGDGLAADSAGNFYVGYEGNNFFAYVAVFDSKGRFIRNWQVDSRLAGIRVPKIAVGGPDGLVYVAPRADPETIKVYRADGSFVRQFGAGSKLGTGVGDLEVDASGNVYASSAAVTGRPDRFVVRFDPAGNVTRTWVPQPGGRSNVGGGIAVAADGSIYEVGLPVASGHSTLTHLASDGAKLSAKELDKTLGTGEYKDVDYANGHLYLAGHFSTAAGVSHHHVLAVLGGDETVQDQILGEGSQVAVSGTHVWVTELVASPTNSRNAASNEFSIGGMDEVPIEYHDKMEKFSAWAGACGHNIEGGFEYVQIPYIILGATPPAGCDVDFVNGGSPCKPGGRAVPVQAYVGGKPVGLPQNDGYSSSIRLKPNQMQTGPVIFSWSCRNIAGTEVEHHYEWKGSIYRLGDPSGTVYDARSGRPLPSATVQIQFSESASGPFGAPKPLTSLPQADHELTGADGRFRWDVAEGYWRLRARAVGYHSVTGRVYKVPPEVTGIKLELRPDPAQQRFLIDPRGRVGNLRIGMRASSKLRVSGLSIRVVRGHIRAITIRSKRYRTPTGIKLGSPRRDFEAAFPREATRALQKAKTGAPKTFLVKKATFTVKGSVTAIKLGR
jgi:hypothetical protein